MSSNLWLNLTDEELAAQVQRGDLTAFTGLVERYKDRLYNLGYRMLRNPSDAEEIAQEAFLHVFRAIQSFQTDQRFSAWCYRIASNLCIDRLRRRPDTRVSLDEPVTSSDLYFQLADTNPLPDAQVEAGELREEIQRAIGALPPKYRLVVVFRHVDDLSYEEIAQITELPMGTVKTRLFRAREILRRSLEHITR
ncbi:MAG: sigma-70 family RNA polymerase sigma factor [Bacillota bacterium]|jgi:RNA polymerase sigma-70 factor (ECF subfamily)